MIMSVIGRLRHAQQPLRRSGSLSCVEGSLSCVEGFLRFDMLSNRCVVQDP